VRILVVVANTQTRPLRAEAEKGSARTAFGRGSVDPEGRGKPAADGARPPAGNPGDRGNGGRRGRAGPERESGRDPRTGRRAEGGDAHEPGDAGGGPGEGSLSSLTAGPAPESDRPEVGPGPRQSAPASGASGAPPPDLENPGERIAIAPGRTDNRSGSPR
jgi:hypothetical protein